MHASDGDAVEFMYFMTKDQSPILTRSFFVRFDCKFGLLLGEHGGVKSMDDMIALFSEDDDKAISLLLLLTDLDQQQGFRDEGEGDARVTRVTLSEIERTDGDEEMPAGMRVRRRLRRQVAR